MINKKIKKIAALAVGILAILIIILSVHIYIVTRPKTDEHTIVMARLNIDQNLNSTEAKQLTTWLYQQKGIDHVLYNPTTHIAIFTYHPTQANADQVVTNLNANMNYKAIRFMPSADQMKSGCPVMGQSMTGKIYQFIKHI